MHLEAFFQVKELLGERPLVLDREFSYSWLLSQLKEVGIHFVVRLKAAKHPTFTDKEDRRKHLSLAPGEKVFLEGLHYKGEVEVNVAGLWEPGHPEPLWVITDLDPKEALSIYRKRMAIEEETCLKNCVRLHGLRQARTSWRRSAEARSFWPSPWGPVASTIGLAGSPPG